MKQYDCNNCGRPFYWGMVGGRPVKVSIKGTKRWGSGWMMRDGRLHYVNERTNDGSTVLYGPHKCSKKKRIGATPS